MRKTFRVLFQILAIAVLLALVGGGWILRSRDQQVSTHTPPAPVRVTQALRMDIHEDLEVYGNLRSANQVTILPKVAGSVNAIHANIGDTVKEGDLLLEIDSEAYRLDLQRARAAYETAWSTWERIDRLYQSGNVTRQEWENARANAQASEAQEAAARLRYQWTFVRSPIDGRILIRHASSGSLVSPEAGTPLFTAGSIDQLEVEFFVSEEYLRAFVGEYPELELRLESRPEINLPGEVDSIAPYVDPVTRRFSVLCRVPPENASQIPLRPGMLVRGRFVLSVRRDVRVLPERALVSGNTLWYADGEGRAKSLMMASARIIEGYLLLPADSPEVSYIVEGQHFLKDGAELRILGDSDQ